MEDDGANDFFDTHKSVAVNGNRIYVSMQHKTNGQLDDTAWLVAIDVDPSAQDPADILTVAWHYPFATGINSGGAGSKSSPMFMNVGSNGKPVVFFDGWYGTEGPVSDVWQIFAVQDDGGANRSLVWQKRPDVPTFAAFLADPGGSAFWHVQTR